MSEKNQVFKKNHQCNQLMARSVLLCTELTFSMDGCPVSYVREAADNAGNIHSLSSITPKLFFNYCCCCY